MKILTPFLVLTLVLIGGVHASPEGVSGYAEVHYFDFGIERITGLHEDEIDSSGCKYTISKSSFLSLLSPGAPRVLLNRPHVSCCWIKYGNSAQMSVANILNTLEAAALRPDASAIFEQQADLFFQELLEHECFPEDYFVMLLDILSRPSFYKIDGVEMFLYQTYASLDAVSDEQKWRLLSILVTKYSDYDREKVCFVAADFLGRVYPGPVALEAVEKIAENAHRQVQRDGLLLALDLLRKANKSDIALLSRCERVQAVLAGNKSE